MRKGLGVGEAGANGTIVVFAARPDDATVVEPLAGAFALIGLALHVVPARRCERTARQARRSKVVVVDPRGEVIYERVLRACAPIDLFELIERIGD